MQSKHWITWGAEPAGVDPATSRAETPEGESGCARVTTWIGVTQVPHKPGSICKFSQNDILSSAQHYIPMLENKMLTEADIISTGHMHEGSSQHTVAKFLLPSSFRHWVCETVTLRTRLFSLDGSSVASNSRRAPGWACVHSCCQWHACCAWFVKYLKAAVYDLAENPTCISELSRCQCGSSDSEHLRHCLALAVVSGYKTIIMIIMMSFCLIDYPLQLRMKKPFFLS